MFKHVISPTMAAVCAIACTGLPERKDHWPYGVRYEVFVRSFADSDGDGIGDLNGLTGSLDHLADLGVNAVWLMPVMPSPSYHKYDVVDYRGIDPDYGTLEDFRNLVQEAHRRGIRIIIDLVVNHTGSGHPWFRQAVQDRQSPYRRYYVWADRDSIRQQIAKKTLTLDSDNITQWHPVNGDTIAPQYYGFFWGGMPDLNMDNPSVRRELVEIGRFWLDSMDVDGFRLDAARHIYPDDRAEDNHRFWIWFRNEMRRIKPDVYLVGEVWATAEVAVPYLPGLPSLFNFDLAYSITRVLEAGRDTVGLSALYHHIDSAYRTANPGYIDATFLRNHDQNRILSELGGDIRKARLAAALLLTFPGAPYIYYGEEIGMMGRKPDETIREPFLWDAKERDARRTSWEKPVYSTDSTVVPLVQQQRFPGSMYRHYRQWVEFRNDDPVMTYGDFVPVKSRPELVAFMRQYGGQTRLVVHNVSDRKAVLPGPAGYRITNDVAFGKGWQLLEDGSLEIQPSASLVVSAERRR